jgi:hypothetical protein
VLLLFASFAAAVVVAAKFLSEFCLKFTNYL